MAAPFLLCSILARSASQGDALGSPYLPFQGEY